VSRVKGVHGRGGPGHGAEIDEGAGGGGRRAQERNDQQGQEEPNPMAHGDVISSSVSWAPPAYFTSTRQMMK
jgi:hypothetical protein